MRHVSPTAVLTAMKQHEWTMNLTWLSIIVNEDKKPYVKCSRKGATVFRTTGMGDGWSSACFMPLSLHVV